MSAPRLEGRLLGGAYRIGRLIGQGAMGAVYEATLERLGHPVAVKLLLRGNGPLTHDQVQRFEREARAAAALGHPNIVQVTDFQWLSGEPPVLVMERLAGESLGAMVGRVGRLGPGLACFLGTQILDALAAAHRAGIIHRDVKPDNVCLVPVGTGMYLAKVVDFGVAKLVGEAPITSSGALVGTPAYMAPEQAMGQQVDPRTDVYAVGATLYHVLSGRLPIDEGTPIDKLIEQIVRVPPPPLVRVVPGIDAGLSAAIERAMAKDIARRFPSAESFRAAIAPFALATPSYATPPAPSTPSTPSPWVGPGMPAPTPPLLSAPPGSPHHARAASAGGELASASTSVGPLGPAGLGGPPPVQGALGFAPPAGRSVASSGALKDARSGWFWVALAVPLLALLALAGALFAVTHTTSKGAPPSAKASKATKTPAVPVSVPGEVPPALPSASVAPPSTVPSGARPPRRDGGPEVADAAAPQSADASAPPPAPARGVTRVMTRNGANMTPFGANGIAAIRAVDASMGLFTPCAQTACVRKDLVVRDEPWAAIDVKYVADANGDTKPAGFSSLLPPGSPCPLFEQCLARRAANVKFPKALVAGPFSYSLQVIERPDKTDRSDRTEK